MYNNSKHTSHKRKMNNPKYRKRYRQVMRNRIIFAFICIFAIFFVVKIFGNIGKAVKGNKVQEIGKKTETTTPYTEINSSNKDVENNYTYNKGIVCIDAGHGGNDGGAVGNDGSLEKNDTLTMAIALKTSLENYGIKVYMTRTTDEYCSLEERVNMANSINADLMISIHRNSYETDNRVSGFETWIDNDENDGSEELANEIQMNLEAAGITKNRGVKSGSQGSVQDDYYINEYSNCPSCLLEMGFITNEQDNNIYRNNTDELAGAVAQAVKKWLEETK